MVSVQVMGLKEVEKKMRSLGPDIARKALRGALAAGAKVIKQDVIARAPVDTGRVRRAVYVKRMTKTGPLKENFIVGVRNGKELQKRDLDAWYWKFSEFGTKFMSRQSFVAPAFESKKNAALDRIREVLIRKISQIVGGKA